MHDGSWQSGHQENSRSKAGHFATSLPPRGGVLGERGCPRGPGCPRGRWRRAGMPACPYVNKRGNKHGNRQGGC
ncbi:hypothetical protein RR42_m1531 [Cupriavidus basilensis]|uniref:Uncharacterized protein n=1 Tax=Cupriavidus basilensis TaxID=68895 RepID=A0A0C4Y9I4_9BURK|nr:hypothetical protein RR42_m1531 [Cupriavidus basilensis]